MNKRNLDYISLKKNKEVLDFINKIYRGDDLINNMLLKISEEEFFKP